MTKQDNPEYFAHLCLVIEAVFAAENKLTDTTDIKKRLKAKKITPRHYVEAIAEEMISRTDKSEIENDCKN